MNNVVNLEFPKCCECGSRATKHVDLIDECGADGGKKHFCSIHGNVLSEIDLCLLLDEKDEEIERLRKIIANGKNEPGKINA